MILSICCDIVKMLKYENGAFFLHFCMHVQVKGVLKKTHCAYAGDWQSVIILNCILCTEKTLQPAAFHYVKSRCSFWLLVNAFSCAWHCCRPLCTEPRQRNNASGQDFLLPLPAITSSTFFFVCFGWSYSSYSHFAPSSMSHLSSLFLYLSVSLPIILHCLYWDTSLLSPVTGSQRAWRSWLQKVYPLPTFDTASPSFTHICTHAHTNTLAVHTKFAASVVQQSSQMSDYKLLKGVYRVQRKQCVAHISQVSYSLNLVTF